MYEHHMARSPQAPARTQPQLPRYPARKSAAGELLIWLLVRLAVGRMFVRVRLHVASSDPRTAAVPIIAVANHPSWWDGYLALLLSRRFGLPRYLMMDAAQLRRYGFFAWAGCFGVERDDPRDVGRAIVYASRLFAAHRNALLWMFPQGEIVPADVRPVVVHRGVAHVIRRATETIPEVSVMPVAWQLIYRGEQHPEVVIRTGEIMQLDRTTGRDVSAVTHKIQCRLTETMDALHYDLVHDDLRAYRVILRGQRGINDRFDRLLNRDRLVPDP